MRRNTFTYLKIGFLSCFLVGVIACKHNDEDEFIFSGLDDSYSIERLKVLTIPTNASGSVTWSINDSVISQSSALEFISPKANAYPLTLKINNKGNEQVYHSKIIVTKEKVPYSKYIAKVLEFRPAVGQFMNEIPEYTPGNTAANMLQKANESLVGGNSTMISLGGYGGYVVFGFDHTIPNLNGRDFKILGNAFFGNDASDPRSGSCEPGIIMVAYDRNKNGKPDNDEWYEIAGSEYFKNTTVKITALPIISPMKTNLRYPEVNSGRPMWNISNGPTTSGIRALKQKYISRTKLLSFMVCRSFLRLFRDQAGKQFL